MILTFVFPSCTQKSKSDRIELASKKQNANIEVVVAKSGTIEARIGPNFVEFMIRPG